MLDVVYGRATRVRRRRRLQLGAGLAAVAMGLAALLVLPGGGDDGAARLRVAGERELEGENASVETGGVAGGAPAQAPSTTAAPASGPNRPATAPAGRPTQALTGGPLATTPTTVRDIRLLKAVTDAQGDSVPDRWWFDVVAGAMHFDVTAGVLTFTTSYRAPDQSGARDDRLLQSVVAYDGEPYAVVVHETSGALGQVTVHDTPCPGCTAEFDSVAARLVVTVPLDDFNQAVATYGDDSSPLGPNGQVGLTVGTRAELAPVEADSSDGGGM